MLLVEPIDRINKALLDFGRVGNEPRYRVVFSEDLTEMRIVNSTLEGFAYVNPRIEERKKYTHIKDRYVLERLTEVPEGSDLLTKLSYEPVWTFEDRFGKYLPPRIDACKFVIEAIESNIHNAGEFKKYKDPNDSEETRQEKILEMEDFLFGEETPVSDALSHKYGVTDFHQKVDFGDKA